MSDRPRIVMIEEDDLPSGGSSSLNGDGPQDLGTDAQGSYTDAPLAGDAETFSPYGLPRPGDSWGMRKYLLWAAWYHRTKVAMRRENFSAAFNDMPEWKQGGSLALAIVVVAGLFWMATTAVQLSQPLPEGQIENLVDPPSEEEVAATAEETYNQAVAAIEGGQYMDALLLIDSLPDTVKDKATLKSEATEKMKAESDKVRFKATYDQGVEYLKAKDYPMAVETFQVLLDASTGSSMYKDADKLLAQAIAESGDEDQGVADEALGDLDGVNDEQRERKALRVYLLTFMRDSSSITDAAYRGRETLVNVTNGWRKPSVGAVAIQSALDRLREARADLSTLSAPSGLDDVHTRFMSSAGELEDDLLSALDHLDGPYSKSAMKKDMAALDSHNDEAVSLRQEFKDARDALDAAARQGAVLADSEIDKDLGGER